jgi:hypothetical protein
MKTIIFSSHAEMKFQILASHGFPVLREEVMETILHPDRIDFGYHGKKIAQKAFDEGHVLRVIFSELPDLIRIITFYPGRRERHEAQIQQG